MFKVFANSLDNQLANQTNNDVVILYSDFTKNLGNNYQKINPWRSMEPMYYGEYFGVPKSFNEAFQKHGLLFFNNTIDKNALYEQFSLYEPAKITYYVDKNGNPTLISNNVDHQSNANGVNQNKQAIRNRTILDAMYNPPWLVTINTINAANPQVSSEWIYYRKNPKDLTLLLLKNQKHMLYSIILENQSYFFNTYGNAYKYLTMYVMQKGVRY